VNVVDISLFSQRCLVWSVEQPMDSISIGKIETFFMIVRTQGDHKFMVLARDLKLDKRIY
jgi:hypothetical protein